MKKVKKIGVVVLVLVLAAAALAACAKQEEVIWTIAIEGADAAEFTNADYSELNSVTIDVTKVNKEGTETEQTWEGVLLSDLLDAVGANDYTSITVEASDGYSKEYTADMVNDELTILGTVVDGEKLTEDDGYVQTVVGSESSSMWIKMVTKITVNK